MSGKHIRTGNLSYADYLAAKVNLTAVKEHLSDNPFFIKNKFYFVANKSANVVLSPFETFTSL